MDVADCTKNERRNTPKKKKKKILVDDVCHVLEDAIQIVVARLPTNYGYPDLHRYAIKHLLLLTSIDYDINFQL